MSGPSGSALPICAKTYIVAGVSLLGEIAAVGHPGDSIRERRIELGWTQSELAERSGVTQADISKIENGHLDARWSTIQRLSSALSGDHRPVRSLANGGRRDQPALSATKWRAKGPTLPVDRAGR